MSKMHRIFLFAVILIFPLLHSCGVISTTYNITSGTVKAVYKTAKFATKLGIGTAKLSYKIGSYTFDVVSAPFDWPMTHDIESIDGLSPQEAIKQGKVKNSPYTVRGKRYVPMSVDEAMIYKETGIASWYGEETLRQKDGHMTANGEAFDPDKPTAAHKHLPLPTHVKVVNNENSRSMIVRVNDRGPFIDGRIIDLSAGVAKKLGFHSKGMANVSIETVQI